MGELQWRTIWNVRQITQAEGEAAISHNYNLKLRLFTLSPEGNEPGFGDYLAYALTSLLSGKL